MESLQFLILWAGISVSSANLVFVPGLGNVEGITETTTWTNRSFQSFYSVNFGKSPSGNRRFMPPVPAKPWGNVYNATVPRRPCPQLYMTATDNPEEDLEDCLTMNIFTPRIGKAARSNQLLPVMVFIHGGGFAFGSAQQYYPNYLLEKDIVLVIPQYRLGIFGFMSLEIDEIAGNVGLMDQVLALEWVHKHIRSFGGDNRRVTIFGQSAGAAAVSLLLVSPMVNNNLFQQAIVQSGSLYSTWAVNDGDPKGFPQLVFSKLTNISGKTSDVVMSQYFRNATVSQLIAATELASIENILDATTQYNAVVQKAGQKKFLDTHPEILIQRGQFRTVPMIAGTTRDEGSSVLPDLYGFCENLGTVNDSNFLKHNLTSLTLRYSGVPDRSSAILNTFEDKYFKEIFDSGNVQFSDMSPGLTDILSILTMKGPTFRQAKINSQYSPTYYYTFDYQGEQTLFGLGLNMSRYPFKGGVTHADDLLYLFPPYIVTELIPTSPIYLNDADTIFAKNMVDLWTSFAIAGAPVSNMTNAWTPKLKGENGPYIHLQSAPYMDDDYVHNEYDVTTRLSKIIT